MTIEYGSFHFKYYIDNELVAVSVVDILPNGLSSVYFFYDPKMKKLGLGVVGALKDIKLVQEKNALFSNFQYVYMGYYIVNINKMNYKADY